MRHPLALLCLVIATTAQPAAGQPDFSMGDGLDVPLVTFNMADRVNLFRFAQGEEGFGDFGIGMGDVAGANGEVRRNRFLCVGYNVSGGCARLVDADQSFHASIESNYRTSEGIRQSEFYMTFRWPSDVFPASRVFGITPHLDSPFVQVDFSSSQFNINDVDGTTRFAQVTAGGPTFTGPNAFFNAATNRAQFSFGALTARRTYTAPDASGTFVLSDSNNLVSLPGGIRTGTTGTGAETVMTRFVAGSDNNGTRVEFSGADMLIIGREESSPTVTVVPAAAQTAATALFTNAARQTKASVMPDGTVYGTSFRVGESAQFGNAASIEGAFSANRTVTLPDVSGTLLVGVDAVGHGSAGLGSNCPATAASAPYTWLKVMASDGSTVYVPAWK